MGKRKRQTLKEPDKIVEPADQQHRFLHRLDADMRAYFQEVKSHFDALGDDPQERHVVADSCLQEAVSRPLQVATDADCSRILEALLPCASEEAVIRLLEGLLDDGSTWLTVCTKYLPLQGFWCDLGSCTVRACVRVSVCVCWAAAGRGKCAGC